MFTIAETEIFTTEAQSIWSDTERTKFTLWLAASPQAGDVIPGTGGCRKVRWSRAGMGKRGGVRVIYFNRLESGVIWLPAIYTKAVRGNVPAHLLKAIKETIDHD